MAKKQKHKNGHKTAIQELNDLAIMYVQSNEELLAKTKELMEIEWRTVKVPDVAHMTIVWAGYNEDTVLVEIAVDDAFAKQLMKEYMDNGISPPEQQEG